MKEPDFRDYHLLLDEQAENIFAMTDDVGASAQDWRNMLCSFSDIQQQQRVKQGGEESAKRTKSLSRRTRSVRLRSHSRAVTELQNF